MDVKQDQVGRKRPQRTRGPRGWLLWAARPIGVSRPRPSPSRKRILAEEADYGRLIACLAILKAGLEIVG